MKQFIRDEKKLGAPTHFRRIVNVGLKAPGVGYRVQPEGRLSMTDLSRSIDSIVRTEHRAGRCQFQVEAWSPDRVWAHAARMSDVEWGPCLQTPGGSWLLEGSAKNSLAFLHERA